MSLLFAALYDRSMRASEEACLAAWRCELLAELYGRVLEIGAGTGANLVHYPRSVTRLVLTEPDRHMKARLARRVAAMRSFVESVEVEQASVEALPFADASFEAVVATLVLCSVPDQPAALGEIRRVLAPGGRFVFIEHVAAADASSRRVWQGRIEPLWKRLAGNCHLTRHTAEAIGAAGFEFERLERQSIRKAMPLVRPSVRGIARKPNR